MYAIGPTAPAAVSSPELAPHERETKRAFTQFVGTTLFSQMLAAMRKTQDPPAYWNGGRAEEIFQQQFDQRLAEHLTEATADQLAGPMFDLVLANMRQPG